MGCATSPNNCGCDSNLDTTDMISYQAGDSKSSSKDVFGSRSSDSRDFDSTISLGLRK